MKMEKFSVSMPLSNEYLTTVRLATGGLCALCGFDVDSAEDFKVCVTESLLILKRNGFQAAEISFGVGEKLSCTVSGQDGGRPVEKGADDEISYALLNALIGNAEFKKNAAGLVQTIAFEA